MSHIRLFLLGVLAACALSAAASTPAFAGSCTGNTNWVFCNGSGTEIPSPTLFLGLGSTLSLLASTVGGAEVKIDCADVHLHGLLLSLGLFHGTLLYLTCQIVKPTNCTLTMKNELDINASFHGVLNSGLLATLTGSGTGQEFTSIEIATGGTCAIAGKYTVTGSQLVEIPKGHEAVVEQEIVAKKALSKLKFGTEPASYSGTAKAMLASGVPWLNMFGI